jgi:dTDP-4-dehydrorhamnose 3,5-epimerase
MAIKLGTIDGVAVKPLKRIVDDRGWLMEIFRSDWPEFQKFGQTYMTTCRPGVVKG